MSSEPLVLTTRHDGVLEITLNRPASGNALNPELAVELAEIANRCVGDTSIRAVIVTGAGRMFCAGGDLSSFASGSHGTHALLLSITGGVHAYISRMTRMNAPVISAVNGMAAGGGFSLAISGDLILGAESSKYLVAYTNAGLSPDASSSWFLPRLVGHARASELMLTNRILSAEEACDWGLINRVVSDTDLMDEARKLAGSLAKGPTRSFGTVKRLLADSFTNGLETQMEHEARGVAEASVSRDGREGVSAFLEKRKPTFVGE